MKNEKVYTYIGRFQIPHTGHEETLRLAVKKADRVIVLIGSSNQARDPKNPFTFEERKSVLESILFRLASEEWERGRDVKYNILPIQDNIYNNNSWLMDVQSSIQSVTSSTDITLTGFYKDTSSTYLSYFQYNQDFIPEQKKSDGSAYHSSSYRKQYFSNDGIIGIDLPPETKEFLYKFKKCNEFTYNEIVNETKFVDDYRRKMYDTLPYTNIPFLTGDSLVVASGHILLVKRRSYPGKGLWALPGGFFDAFKDQDQTETALRELKEETKIDVPMKVLKGSIRKVEEFGDMNRSLRWRIITKCVYIQLDDTVLPKVKGSDDAELAMWVPLSEIDNNSNMFFEDHRSIIKTMIGI